MNRLSIKLIPIIGLLVACIPAQEPSQNTIMPALLNVTYVPAQPDVVHSEILSDLFPASGPEALQNGEEEHLQYQMYQRYNEGFYEPLVQPMIARDMKGLFDFAKEEDGATLESVNKEFATEIRRVKQTIPVEILWKLRFMAANSVIMQEEMIREAGFWEEGDLDKTDFEESRDFMRDLYSEITIELQKRGEL